MPHRLALPITALVATFVAVGYLLATAIPAMACSCVGPQPMAAYAGSPDQVVFTGIVQAPDGRGVPVAVTHWFQGDDAAPIVWLDRAGFGGDGGMCGTSLPPAGAEWIFVAWGSEGSELSVNLCTPHAAASDPAGQAMYQDAVATFGEGIVPGGEAGGDPSSSTSPGRDTADAPALLLVGGAVVLLLMAGGAAVVLARGRRAEDDPR
jgi:hypothetical protein